VTFIHKSRSNISVAAVLLIVFGLLLTLVGTNLLIREVTKEKVYVGIDVVYDDETAIFRLVNQVSSYVNLIVLGSLGVTTNTTKLTEVCDFLYEKDLHFIIFVAYPKYPSLAPDGPPQTQFFQMAIERWGDKFLGAYVFDEPGGKQMDGNAVVLKAENCSDAAEQFVTVLNKSLSNTTDYYRPAKLRLYTSDYALYSFDYLAGYDVVFGEFGSSNRGQSNTASRQLTVALCRGAAESQNKDWGTIITWTSQQPPYLEDAGQLYSDMVLAYQNDAKYIVVFDSPGNITEYGALTNQHLDSMKKFWIYMETNPAPGEDPAKTAYVLPMDYGYGFRGSTDRIWGIYNANELSPIVWDDATNLINHYGQQLDIVYENTINNGPARLPYDTLIFWNRTVISK
jgi:hypothetical protein